MSAEFAALPPTVPDSDTLQIVHFQEVAARLAAQGENFRAQYYADYARALAAGQPVVQGVAIGSGEARVTTAQEWLPDGVTVSNLRATATNVPRSGILEQPPAFARVEQSSIYASEAANALARLAASDQRPVIVQEPIERIGPVKVPPLVGRALAAVGIVGRVTTGYQSHGEYEGTRVEVLNALAADVAEAARQQIRPRAQELADDPDFQNRVAAVVAAEAKAAEATRIEWMNYFAEHPGDGIPDWIKAGGPTNLNLEET